MTHAERLRKLRTIHQIEVLLTPEEYAALLAGAEALEREDAAHPHAAMAARAAYPDDQDKREAYTNGFIAATVQTQAQPLGYVCGQHMQPATTCPACERDELRTQLEVATASQWPKCAFCDKPAVCFGISENNRAFSCDDHCEHGCEDGWCEMLVEVRTRRLMYEREKQLGLACAVNQFNEFMR